MNKHREEYYFLTERVDEIKWALKGECNDIDCDKYMYKNLLKKKYKPLLEHGFSCMKVLRMERDAIMRILSQKRYRKYRYTKCAICKKYTNKLDKSSKIVSFTRPSERNKNYHELKSYWVHHSCSKKVKVPKGWEKF